MSQNNVDTFVRIQLEGRSTVPTYGNNQTGGAIHVDTPLSVSTKLLLSPYIQ